MFVAIGCKTKGGATGDGDADTGDASTEKVVKDITMTESFMLPKAIDPVTVEELSIDGDILEIEVSYGGCGEHEFTLYGNRSFQKSLPPKLGLALIHDGQGDQCKKRSTQTLYFNIKDIRYPGKDSDYVIVVYVNGDSGKSVDYKY